MATARALLAAALLALCCAPMAQAASQVYWGNYGGSPATISYADLGGAGGGDVDTTGATVEEPLGLAIDATAGRVYWANDAAPKISFASLAGGGGGDLNTTGVTTNPLAGIAVYPAAGKLYWGNVSPDAIAFANLDGSGGGGYLSISGATVEGPSGVAVDPAAGKIYWSNDMPANKISVANLDGSGATDLNTGAASVERPFGVAVDGSRVYWANWDSSKISYANLDGSGGGDLAITGTSVDHPSGIAIDPTAGRIYWTSYTTNKISYANLDGSGGGDVITTGATTEGPAFPVLLEPPVGIGPPEVAGGSAPSSSLSCTGGSWAPDLLGSFLYRAPQSFSYQWSRGESEVTGGIASTLSADTVGNYQCRVTAANHAGSATQSSARHGVFRVGRPKLNRRRGTATLPVTVPPEGVLRLSGRGVVTRISRKAGKVKLAIRAKGRKRKRLIKRGRVKLKVLVTFTPAGGSPGSQQRSIRLRKKARR
jgi:hypothetical protein